MKPTPSSRLPTLVSLRASLLAAMGLAACGGEVTLPPGTGGAGGTGGAASTQCAGATPINAADGSPTGFERCPDGAVFRAQPKACSVTEGITACQGTETTKSCNSDAECTDKPHGKCASVSYADFGGPTTACQCAYPCADDAECGAGNVCVCGGVIPGGYASSACAAASCAASSDCSSGECGVGAWQDGCGTEVFLACRAAGDACRTAAECTEPGATQCALSSAGGPWSCLGQNCAIGRPLVVDGEIRAAEPCERTDWTMPGLAIPLAGLDAATREIIAEHWLTVGALEHASVASFARFTLELLALGAPSDLLAETQRAGFDEVEHARMAYAVASVYAGRKLGPDVLNLAAVPVRADAREIIPSLVAEACVGETLGVAEAIDLTGRARDVAMARVYARIAADEARHAELAWRTLAWLLAGADEETAALTGRAFAETIAAASRDPAPRERALPEHGLLASSQIGFLRRRALREVVEPCVAALLGEARRRREARPAAPFFAAALA
jgi:hypothetical protein